MSDDLLLSEELTPDLLPHKHRLSPRFYEARRSLVAFIKEEVLPVRPEWARQRAELEVVCFICVR